MPLLMPRCRFFRYFRRYAVFFFSMPFFDITLTLISPLTLFSLILPLIIFFSLRCRDAMLFAAAIFIDAAYACHALRLRLAISPLSPCFRLAVAVRYTPCC